MTLEKQIAEDYGMVLKEAQSMGCNKINDIQPLIMKTKDNIHIIKKHI